MVRKKADYRAPHEKKKITQEIPGKRLDNTRRTGKSGDRCNEWRHQHSRKHQDIRQPLQQVATSAQQESSGSPNGLSNSEETSSENDEAILIKLLS
ncbi:hypothetical protein TNCV_465441 [Trichonephila clavipes]|nr:hypothetical protein TNCV_465441 [Trichonephila clavipes]